MLFDPIRLLQEQREVAQRRYERCRRERPDEETPAFCNPESPSYNALLAAALKRAPIPAAAAVPNGAALPLPPKPLHTRSSVNTTTMTISSLDGIAMGGGTGSKGPFNGRGGSDIIRAAGDVRRSRPHTEIVSNSVGGGGGLGRAAADYPQPLRQQDSTAVLPPSSGARATTTTDPAIRSAIAGGNGAATFVAVTGPANSSGPHTRAERIPLPGSTSSDSHIRSNGGVRSVGGIDQHQRSNTANASSSSSAAAVPNVDALALKAPGQRVEPDFANADEDHNPEYKAPTEEPQFECHQCGRRFLTTDRLDRHAKSCREKPRAQFDVAGRRVAAIAETAGVDGLGTLSHSSDAKSAAKASAAKHKAKWRDQSAQLQAIMKAAQKGEAPPALVIEDDRVECRGCGKKFAEETHRKHEAKCIERNRR